MPAKLIRTRRSTADLADALLQQIRLSSLPTPEREYRFAPPRRWRFDLVWPGHKLAVECDGGVFTAGRHTRGRGYTADCDKLNAATVAGFRVLRFTAEHIRSGKALKVIEEALGRAGNDLP